MQIDFFGTEITFADDSSNLPAALASEPVECVFIFTKCPLLCIITDKSFLSLLYWEQSCALI